MWRQVGDFLAQESQGKGNVSWLASFTMLRIVHELRRSIAELQAEYESNLEEQARVAPRRKTVARRAKRPATKR